MTRRARWISTGALAVIVSFLVTACGQGSATKPLGTAADHRPNIVFVLTDDLDWSLVNRRYMPHVIELERRGVTFSRYFVADSLCCPSRATILTGDFPHDTGVLTNFGPHGGLHAFNQHGDERHTFAIALQRAGYRTAMMGKYLNGYMAGVGPRADGAALSLSKTYVPPGWTGWDVAGWGYPEFDYALNQNGHIVHYGTGPPPAAKAANYLTDVLSWHATRFIDQAAVSRRPFALEVATFAPHSPYTPAPRNARDFPGLRAPRDRAFNAQNINPPDWLGTRRKLTRRQVAQIDADYRMRAQAVEAVDRLLGRVESELAARGLANNTYIIFSSDNGYHMGQHRLLPGKETAFETDIRVPLVIAGPGVPHGRIASEVVQNTDLYPTLVQLGGGRAGRTDGSSLVPLLHGPHSRGARWPTLALIEHHGPTDVGDPDLENGKLGGNPASYDAIRISDRQFGNAVYVEYARTGGREYYNIDTDPAEIHNSYGRLSPSARRRLHRMLVRLKTCHGASSCWAAADPQNQSP